MKIISDNRLHNGQDCFKTLVKKHKHEIVIKKSRFISTMVPLYEAQDIKEAEEQASEMLTYIRREYYDATHNCYAYVIGDQCQIQKASDDGEPSGTAGKPILEVLKKTNLRNVLVVVTRYFGGVMLGAGGLIRAYGQATSEGLQETGSVNFVRHNMIDVTVEYHWIGKLENELHNKNVIVTAKRYLEKACFTIAVEQQQTTQSLDFLTDLTNGQAEYTIRDKAVYIS